MSHYGETKKQKIVLPSLVVSVLLILLISVPPAAAVQEDSAPLERAPASQSEIQNSFGKELDSVLVDQQILIVADVVNALDRQQSFAYIVQIQDENGVVVGKIIGETDALILGATIDAIKRGESPGQTVTGDTQQRRDG